MCLATHDRSLWRAGLSPPPRPAYPHERVVAGGRCGGWVGADRAPRLLGGVDLVELRLVEAPFDHVEVVRQPLGGAATRAVGAGFHHLMENKDAASSSDSMSPNRELLVASGSTNVS